MPDDRFTINVQELTLSCVMGCSLAAQGLWFRILYLGQRFFDGEYLCDANGKRWKVADLRHHCSFGGVIGFRAAFAELCELGACEVTSAGLVRLPNGLRGCEGVRSSISPYLRDEVFRRDGNRCVRCHATDTLSIDHVIPVIRGGSTTFRNLQTLCRRCNSVKGARLERVG